VLHSLKTSRLNEMPGLIIGFDPNSARFMVRLVDGTKCKVRACNLKGLYFDAGGLDHQFQRPSCAEHEKG